MSKNPAEQRRGGEHRVIPIAIRAQKFLSGVDYPASKEDLLKTAREEGAEKDVLEALEKLPDRDYEGPTGISAELKG